MRSILLFATKCLSYAFTSVCCDIFVVIVVNKFPRIILLLMWARCGNPSFQFVRFWDGHATLNLCQIATAETMYVWKGFNGASKKLVSEDARNFNMYFMRIHHAKIHYVFVIHLATVQRNVLFLKHIMISLRQIPF